MRTFDAPIAGANYTADTRNYPWHRPPEIVEYDEAVDYMINKIKEPEQHEIVFSLLEIDMQVSTVVSTLLMQGISKGKYPIDLAILLAGPLARYIGIIADSQGIKYDMGVGDKDRIRITPTSLRLAMGIMDDEAPAEAPEQPLKPSASLMGRPALEDVTAASEKEQAAMLGADVEKEETADGLA